MTTELLLLEDELVDDDCPLHADLELGDITKLSVYDRRWLETIACPDLHFCYDAARRAQMKLRADDLGLDRVAYLRRQMNLACERASSVRARMRRLIAGEPEPSSGPLIDLWA